MGLQAFTCTSHAIPVCIHAACPSLELAQIDMLVEEMSRVTVPGPKPQLVIRTGCLTCRAQGIKCDPGNSQCQQYSSTKWISNRRVNRRQYTLDRADWDTSSTDRPKIYTMNVSWRGTVREKESLHFFVVISAPELSGFLDTKFWQQLLPQATHRDEGIKHAVAAIGASHEYALRRQASRHNSETDGLVPFALRQCNKAINNLLRPNKKMSQGDLLRALTASVLFASFESLSGNREGAVPHVVHSRRLVEQHNKSFKNSTKPSDFPVDLDTIEPLVAHYECQVGNFVYEDDPYGMLNMFDLTAPLYFDRLADARMSLTQAVANYSIIAWSLHKSHRPDDLDAVAKQQLKYTAWFEKWDAAFTLLLARDRTFYDRETLNGCRLLKAHHLAASALIAVDYHNGESGWAAFTQQYKAVVELISTIVDSLPKRGIATQVPQLAYLSSTMGMTEPLYCAATRCTEPTIAEEARSLMKRLPLNEGVHSAWRIEFIEKTLCAATGKYYAEPVGKHEPDTTVSPNERVPRVNHDQDYEPKVP